MISLDCLAGARTCNPYTMEVIYDLESSRYYFELMFERVLAPEGLIGKNNFMALTANPTYSLVQICTRNVLFLISFLSLMVFLFKSLSKIYVENRTWEQKAIIWLGVSLLLYNNPFETLLFFTSTLLKYKSPFHFPQLIDFQCFHLASSSRRFQAFSSFICHFLPFGLG